MSRVTGIAFDAGDVYKELVVYVITERVSGKFVGVFLRQEDARNYNKGAGSAGYKITPFLCSV